MRKLSFYDIHRQNYAADAWPRTCRHSGHIGEFQIGDYCRDGSVDRRGELSVNVYRFDDNKKWDKVARRYVYTLTFEVCAFNDAFGTFRTLDKLDILRAFATGKFSTLDEVTDMFIEKGLRDRSDNPRKSA